LQLGKNNKNDNKDKINKKDLRELEDGEILVETILFIITYVVSKLKTQVSIDVNSALKIIK